MGLEISVKKDFSFLRLTQKLCENVAVFGIGKCWCELSDIIVERPIEFTVATEESCFVIGGLVTTTTSQSSIRTRKADLMLNQRSVVVSFPEVRVSVEAGWTQ